MISSFGDDMTTYRNIHTGRIVHIVSTDFCGCVYILDDDSRWDYTNFHRNFQPVIDPPTTEDSEWESP